MLAFNRFSGLPIAVLLVSAAATHAPAKPIINHAVNSAVAAEATADGVPPAAVTSSKVGTKLAQASEATAAPADAAIAQQLQSLAGKFDSVSGGKQSAAALEAFYTARNYAPIWITDGAVNARAKAAIDYLRHVDADGLDPADYQVPDVGDLADPAAAARAEVKLTLSVVAYARHASIGRVHWSRVSGDIFYEQKAPEPGDVLATVLAASDAGAALDGYEPHAPGYLALKAALAERRAGKTLEGKTPIPSGPVLKVGMKDERVPQLYGRFGVPGDSGTTYDKALAEAVKKFQQEHKIAATGTLTAATVDALNGRQPNQATDIIIANMERWRWMPHDLGSTYVIVNLPEFMLRVIHDGKQVWMTKVVDGKPATPTPIMSADMKYITVNPTWNVPDSIAAKEYIPLLRQDPTILTRAGLTVTHNPDGTLHLSQPPGDNNALGRLRFNFPNKFFVYQHDSNEKYLFANTMRASSHGCMRVEEPPKYAEVLLSLVRPGEGYTEQRIRRMYGNTEMDIRFPTFIPVHLTYQTAFVDDAGKLQFREDVYGHDKALLGILKSDERKIADIPIERKDNAVRREMLAMPEQAWGGTGVQSFFARLFGFSTVEQPVAPQPTTRRHAAQRPNNIH
jgi:murein L,D-transpeptidase YcbB/YkuD